MRVRCPYCDHRFLVRNPAAGLRGRCPNPACRKVIQLPGANALVVNPQSTNSHPPITIASPHSISIRRFSKWVYSATGLLAAVGVIWLLIQSSTHSTLQVVDAAESRGSPAAPVHPPASYQKDLLPFIQKYCSDCHGNGSQEGDFALDRYTDLEGIRRDRAVWTKLLKLVQLESMPPSSADQPTAEERAHVVAWLDHQLFYVDCSTEQDPGRVTVRRLNRTEYNNTVNSLLGIEFKPADDFPSDDVGHGFDNIGDVLTVPPLLIEKYLAAAEAVAQAAVSDHSPHYFKLKLSRDRLKLEGSARALEEGASFASRGRVMSDVEFPRAGPYLLKISARQDRGGKEDAQMEVRLGGEPLKTINVKNTQQFKEYQIPFDATTGTQEISIAFINDFYDEKAKKDRDRNLRVSLIEVEGPLDVTAEERRQAPLTRVLPEGNVSFVQAATENFREFLPRAFRRLVTDTEVAKYVSLVELAAKQESTFHEAMRVALQAVLISPDFLFRVEGGRRQSGQIEMLDDFALASRLSYFLWSSCPDDELFDLARENRLHEPHVLKAQTLRMLADRRASELVANFSSQWLGLRKLSTPEVDPDPKLFPDFTAEIRLDLWKETELFFGSIVHENRSIFELLTGQYSFLNERLARYYGVEGVRGPEFRKVDLPGRHRAGVLTQGSVLTLTSYPNRTSPVKRGEWVLAVLLGDAPPPAPPTTPALDQTAAKNPNLSFRETLELHRTDPGCASCHKTMDAVGFGLENFDAIGRWRTEDNGRPVDSAGVLPDGSKINSPDDLVGVMVGRRNDFARCLTEKLLTYAIGRGVDWYDRCAVDGIVQNLQQDERFSTLVLGIVNSAPFQSRRLQQTEPMGR